MYAHPEPVEPVLCSPGPNLWVKGVFKRGCLIDLWLASFPLLFPSLTFLLQPNAVAQKWEARPSSTPTGLPIPLLHSVCLNCKERADCSRKLFRWVTLRANRGPSNFVDLRQIKWTYSPVLEMGSRAQLPARLSLSGAEGQPGRVQVPTRASSGGEGCCLWVSPPDGGSTDCVPAKKFDLKVGAPAKTGRGGLTSTNPLGFQHSSHTALPPPHGLDVHGQTPRAEVLQTPRRQP